MDHRKFALILKILGAPSAGFGEITACMDNLLISIESLLLKISISIRKTHKMQIYGMNGANIVTDGL